MTETTKNRIAYGTAGVAAIALCVAMLAEWVPHMKVFVDNGNADAATPAGVTATTLAEDDRIVINTADYDTLLLLPDMSEELAREIVAYRREHLPFTRWEDLLIIDGVTGEMVEQWKSCAYLF